MFYGLLPRRFLIELGASFFANFTCKSSVETTRIWSVPSLVQGIKRCTSVCARAFCVWHEWMIERGASQSSWQIGKASWMIEMVDKMIHDKWKVVNDTEQGTQQLKRIVKIWYEYVYMIWVTQSEHQWNSCINGEAHGDPAYLGSNQTSRGAAHHRTGNAHADALTQPWAHSHQGIIGFEWGNLGTGELKSEGLTWYYSTGLKQQLLGCCPLEVYSVCSQIGWGWLGWFTWSYQHSHTNDKRRRLHFKSIPKASLQEFKMLRWLKYCGRILVFGQNQ